MVPELEEQVLLLGIAKRQEGETLKEVLFQMEQVGAFSLKEGKRMLKKLKAEGYLEGEELTVKGAEAARAAEAMFKI